MQERKDLGLVYKTPIPGKIDQPELENMCLSNNKFQDISKNILKHEDSNNPSIIFHIHDEDEIFTFTPDNYKAQKRKFSLKRTIVSLYFNNILQTSIKIGSLDDKTASIFESIKTDCKISFHLHKKNLTINLPEKMSYHLLCFLKNKHTDEDLFPNYCCTHFAYEMVYGLSETKKMEYEDDKIGVASTELTFDEQKLKSGDIVYLYNKKNVSQFHYAINIEDGLYLSLMGRQRKLCIATINEMNKVWNTDSIKHVKLGRVQSNRWEDTAIKVGLFAGVAAGLLFFGSKVLEQNTSTIPCQHNYF